MLGKLASRTRPIGFCIAVTAVFIGACADGILANELPSDSFALLSPGRIVDRPNRNYNGLPMGGWLFYPGLTAGVVYDDNIFQSPTNRTSRFGTRITPIVTAVRDNGIHQLTLYGTADARLYSGVNEADSVAARGGFTHKYEAMRDLVFRIQGDYTRQTDPFNAAGGFNVNAAASNPFGTSAIPNPFSYNQFIGSASVVKMFNKGFVSVRGSISQIIYDNSNRVSGSASIAPSNGTIYAVTARAGHYVNPFFYAYVEPTFDWRRYASMANNSNGYRVVGGLATERVGLFQGEIFGGYQEERGDQTVVSGVPNLAMSIGGTVFGGRVTYDPTRFLKIRASLDETLGVSQVINSSTPQGTSTKTTLALLQADYAMSRVWGLSGRVGFTEVSYVSNAASPGHTNGWLAGVKYTYTFSPSFGVALDYQYTKLESNVPLSGVSRNLITLSGTYRY